MGSLRCGGEGAIELYWEEAGSGDPVVLVGGLTSTVPTLVVAGSHDRLIPTENSRLLAARIPGARLVEIEETAHVFIVERPDAVNAALLEFFASV